MDADLNISKFYEREKNTIGIEERNLEVINTFFLLIPHWLINEGQN